MKNNRYRVPKEHGAKFDEVKNLIGWSGIMEKLTTSSTLPEPVKIEYTQKQDKAELESKSSSRITTLSQLVSEAKIDTDVWDIERHVINKWEVAAKKPDGTGMYLQDLFQVKAWLKKRLDVFNLKAWQAEFMEQAAKYAPRYDAIDYTTPTESHAFEMFITDHHFGKLSHKDETGFNYDLKIAEKNYKDAVDDLLTSASTYALDEIVFVFGSDLQHIDNKNNTTTAGTAMDTDSRWQKIWKTAFRCNVEAIENASKLAKVNVKVVPGNHDFENSFKMGFALECWFRNNPNVSIDNAPTTRKYWTYGKCLVMFTHGNTGKPMEYSKVVANEMREAWGTAKYVEVHTGDKHQTKVMEDKGVRVRILPALCPPDQWHYSSMFIGNILSAEAFLWHREKGLKATFNYNL